MACQWGECTAEATEMVAYPADVPGTVRQQQCWSCGTRRFYFCSSCAEIARDEVAELYPPSMRCMDHEKEVTS